MAKTRAYTSEFGNETVTAEAIGKVRNLLYNGQPTGDRYFSTHRAGYRRPVKHVMKGKCFFSYVEGRGNTSASDGETLNHLLFKEALASVERMKLSVYRLTSGKPAHWQDFPIRIRRAEVEKVVNRANGSHFRTDLSIEFEDDFGLALKWENQLHFEIRHTHAVQADKQIELRDLEQPVVEVEIPDIFSYVVPDDETSDEQEEAHRRRVRAILESERGFLKCVVLSDPCSKRYLHHLIDNHRRKIKSLEENNATLHNSLAASKDQLRASIAETARLSSQIQENRQATLTHLSNLDQRHLELNELQRLASDLRFQRNWLSIAFLALVAAFGLAMFW